MSKRVATGSKHKDPARQAGCSFQTLRVVVQAGSQTRRGAHTYMYVWTREALPVLQGGAMNEDSANHQLPVIEGQARERKSCCIQAAAQPAPPLWSKVQGEGSCHNTGATPPKQATTVGKTPASAWLIDHRHHHGHEHAGFLNPPITTLCPGPPASASASPKDAVRPALPSQPT